MLKKLGWRLQGAMVKSTDAYGMKATSRTGIPKHYFLARDGKKTNQALSQYAKFNAGAPNIIIPHLQIVHNAIIVWFGVAPSDETSRNLLRDLKNAETGIYERAEAQIKLTKTDESVFDVILKNEILSGQMIKIIKMEMYKKGRRSIHFNKDLSKGSIIKKTDLVIKRPGLGIIPSKVNKIIGKKLKKKAKADQWLTWDMI